MSAQPDIRSQLRALSIPRDQRPTAAAPTVGAPARAANGRSRIGLIAAVLLVGLVGWGVYASRGFFAGMTDAAASQTDIRLVPVTVRRPAELPPLLTATGKIVSDHKVQVSTKVSGQIVSLLFEQGDRVKKGQVLARIEDVIYRARRDQAKAQLEKSRANLEYQKVNYARISRLHEGSNAPDIEYTDAKRAQDEGEAQVKADQAALDWAQKALTDCEVLAPIAGVVLERNVEVGDFVAAEGGRGAMANSQLGSIADMATLRVEVDVSELDINRLKKDMPCTIIPDAYKDRRYNGHVMWIDPGANYSKATVQVKVRIESPDDNLRVEGSAQVVFLPERPSAEAMKSDAAPTLWIPASAAVIDADGVGGRVFLASDGRLRETRVRIGRRVGGELQIESGLSSGQMIAADGLDKLSDGQRVKS